MYAMASITETMEVSPILLGIKSCNSLSTKITAKNTSALIHHSSKT